MEKRQLGQSSLQIAPIVFGGNVFGWTLDEASSFAILDQFVEAGFNAIDTADMYSTWVPGNQGGESETIIGRWMAARKNRDKIVLATKVGMEVGGEKGLKKDYIIRSVEKSLKRLQTDYIDLYQAHQDDPETGLEETLTAFDQLVREGKVRVLGASNYEAKRLEESYQVATAKKITPYSVLQPCYNLYDRADYETALEKVCEQHKTSVISYYSLASGFLSGKYRSLDDQNKSARGAGISQKYLNDRGFRILKALDELSEELNASLTQISLAWLLHRPSITAPIVSATKAEQLAEILKAPDLKLNDYAIQKLNSASAWR